MRRSVKALVALVTCLSVHTHALPDIRVSHIELPEVQKSWDQQHCLHAALVVGLMVVGIQPHVNSPHDVQGCFDVLPGSPPPGWTGSGDWEANGLTLT